MPGPRGRAFPRPDGLTLAIVAIALLGVGLVLAREAAYGVAFTWDSVNYLGAARELLTAGDFARALEEREPFTTWGPFYPMLLAAGGFGAFDPLDVAGPLGAAAFALTVLAAGLWMRRAIASRALVVWGCLALACAFPLARIAGFVLSEAPFILFVTLALSRVAAFLDGGGRTALAWAAAFTALACLTRYAGVALVIAALPLLLLRDGPRLRERARDAALYLVVALLPLGLWLARNALLVGSPTGKRIPGDALPAVLGRTFQTLESWLYPGFEAARVERLMNAGTAAMLLALAVVVVACVVRGGGTARGLRGRSFALVNGAFAFMYASFLVITASLTYVDEGYRHLAPLLLPLLLLAVFAVDRLWSWVRERDGERLAVPLAALMTLGLGLWLSLAALRTANDIVEANGEGVRDSFTTARWRDSETVRYVREHRIGLASRLVAAAALPLYGHTVSLDTHADARYYHWGYDLPRLERWIAEADAAGDDLYVVRLRWFGGEDAWSVEDLAAIPGLELAAELSDGAVFRAIAPDVSKSRREAAVGDEPPVR